MRFNEFRRLIDLYNLFNLMFMYVPFWEAASFAARNYGKTLRRGRYENVFQESMQHAAVYNRYFTQFALLRFRKRSFLIKFTKSWFVFKSLHIRWRTNSADDIHDIKNLTRHSFTIWSEMIGGEVPVVKI